MPSFFYKAKKGPGEIVEGEIDAENEDAALGKISGLGLIPVKITLNTGEAPAAVFSKAAAPDAPIPSLNADLRKKIRITYKELNIFTRQFAILLKASVPLLRIFEILQTQAKSVKFRAVLKDIQEALRQGSALSEVLSAYPKIFSQVYVSMVQAGEVSGTLSEVLARLADFAEKESEIRSRVQSAFVYPAFLFFMGVLTVFVLLTFVMPRMIGLFADLDTELPGPTRVIVAISEFCQSYWVWMALAVFAVFAWLRTQGLSQGQKAAIDRMAVKLPLLGNLVEKAETAKFLRSMELLYEHGIPLYQAVAVANKTVTNSVIRAEMDKVPARLEGGATLARSLEEVVYISKFVTHMVAVGEESGQLGTSVRETALFYEQETNQVMKIATSLLEPLMILGIGLVVGFIVIAMLLPIFEIHVLAQ